MPSQAGVTNSNATLGDYDDYDDHAFIFIDNISFLQPIYTNSDYNDDPSTGLVDGNEKTNWLSKSCWASGLDHKTPWWSLDLGEEVAVSSVSLIKGGDCCGD